MLAVLVLYSEAMMLCWTRLCVALQLKLAQDPTVTGYPFPSTKISSAAVPHIAPCFVDDIFAVLREGVGDSGELTNSSLALFGICTLSDNSSGSVLLDLANKKNGLEVLHPAAVHVSEEEEQGTLTLTFDLPESRLLMMNPLLLLIFESPLSQGDLDVTFTSQSLQPNIQTVCISGETQYILLTGKSSESRVYQNWRISAQTKSPDMEQNLNNILNGEKSGSNISMTPLLLFSGETGTDTRCVSGSSPASLQTSFLCELKRFLSAVLPPKHLASPPLPLDSLQSLPPLTLGLSSSETLLAVIINSTAPTIFAFTSWGSMFPVCHGELALSPALLEELRQRLEQTVMQMTNIIKEENLAQGAKESLGRLKELSALQKKKHATGDVCTQVSLCQHHDCQLSTTSLRRFLGGGSDDQIFLIVESLWTENNDNAVDCLFSSTEVLVSWDSQFRAFLLLKALQTVAQTYDVQRKLRATRAGPSSSARGGVCGLRALSVSLTKLLVGPHNANINTCHGSCAFPLANANNHAILLNSHIESGHVDERAPCCVPVAYEALEVVDWNAHGTFISIKPDVVARECGCR